MNSDKVGENHFFFISCVEMAKRLFGFLRTNEFSANDMFCACVYVVWLEIARQLFRHMH